MKNHPCKTVSGFTLIEMLAVITIIVILAGMVVGGMGFVNQRQASEKAKTQIALLSKALEDYKLDNGAYPPTVSGDGTKNTDILFNALYWDTDDDGQAAVDGQGNRLDEDQPTYLNELDPLTNKQGWTSGTPGPRTKIMDPWGQEYRYRSAFNQSGGANETTQNPDFDIWSAGKDGASYPDTPDDKRNGDDIKNF